MVAHLRDAVGFCWVVFIVVWVLAAGRTKRTASRPGGQVLYRVFWFAAFALLYISRPHQRGLEPITKPIVHVGASVALVGLALAIAGLALAFWARATLGTNWSGQITLKEGHTLVRTGPYAAIRHPIYTAILLMFAGSALTYGTLGAIVAFPFAVIGFVIKANMEEELMIATFPDAYPAYREHTKMLVPGVY